MFIYFILCIIFINSNQPNFKKSNPFSFSVHPVIHVPNQLVGAPLGTDVTLECYVEAFPKSINYWVRDTGEDNTLFMRTIDLLITNQQRYPSVDINFLLTLHNTQFQ